MIFLSPNNATGTQMSKQPPKLTINLARLISHLQLCSKTQNLTRAKQIHSHLITTNLHSCPQTTTSLISLYSNLNLPFDSLSAFISSPHPPNLFTFNAIISSFTSNNLPNLALNYYNILRFETVSAPDKFTYPCTIKACTSLGVHCEVQKIHAEVIKIGLGSDKFIASALVHSYLEFGFIDYGQKMFDELVERDVVLWNAMVNGFARKGDLGNAVEYFRQMGSDGIMPSSYTVTGILSVFTTMADVFCGKTVHGLVVKAGFEEESSVLNALIDLYGKCNELVDAVAVFERMREKDLFSWNSMISAFRYSADHEETLRYFGRMRHAGVPPDAVTLAAVLPACSQSAALRHGRGIHVYMITSGISSSSDVFVHNALMDMYAKSGALADANQVFNMMRAHDVASWNIVIHAFAAHGLAAEALELFDAMCAARVAPDEVTFVGLLSACSHTGLVEPGRDIFQKMEVEYGVVPVMEHYSCMVDLLGRAGRLKEAQEVAEQAKEAGVWRAYLAACKMHGQMEQAVEAAERVVGLEPKESGGYVLLANAYGSAGRFEEVEEVRGDMWRKKVRKVTGCSWVEVGGLGLNTFVMGVLDHPKGMEVYAVLHGLVRQMREFGCLYDDILTQGIDQDVEEA